MRFLGSLIGVALIGGLAYLIFHDRVGFNAEEREASPKPIDIHDYGVLDMPVNHLHKGVGRSAGQVDTPYGAPESMTVRGIGQNYNGRAFGL